MRAIVPGFLLCLGLGLASFGSKFFQGFVSPLLIVIVLGMVIASLTTLPKTLDPGIALCQKPLLRWGVAGLGFKLSIQKLGEIGGPALLVVAISTTAALFFGWWVARKVGLNEKLSLLLGVGTGICGASAIVAADSVVNAEKEDTAVSLGVITFLGTLGILIYPLIGRALGLSKFVYGVWNGASLHEMAQVVAAGEAFGATETSTVAKLARICLLAPVVFGLGWYLRSKRGSSGEAKVPLVQWFLVAFVVIACINSTGIISKELGKVLQDIDLAVLCVGMAGVGLKSDFRQIFKAGWNPVIAGFLQWIFLAGVSLALAVALCK
ncbi:MAG: putative sulfate exporter family transporter [Fimbriimonadaceae bacterium]